MRSRHDADNVVLKNTFLRSESEDGEHNAHAKVKSELAVRSRHDTDNVVPKNIPDFMLTWESSSSLDDGANFELSSEDSDSRLPDVFISDDDDDDGDTNIRYTLSSDSEEGESIRPS